MLFYSLAFIDNFIPLEQRINLFFPINRHIFTVLAQLRKMGTTAVFFFCLLTQLLPYKISYFRNAFQSRSGENYISRYILSTFPKISDIHRFEGGSGFLKTSLAIALHLQES